MKDECSHPPTTKEVDRRAPCIIINGTINGQQVDGMLLDSGAAITVVSEEFVPKEARKGKSMTGTIHSDV